MSFSVFYRTQFGALAAVASDLNGIIPLKKPRIRPSNSGLGKCVILGNSDPSDLIASSVSNFNLTCYVTALEYAEMLSAKRPQYIKRASSLVITIHPTEIYIVRFDFTENGVEMYGLREIDCGVSTVETVDERRLEGALTIIEDKKPAYNVDDMLDNMRRAISVCAPYTDGAFGPVHILSSEGYAQ